MFKVGDRVLIDAFGESLAVMFEAVIVEVDASDSDMPYYVKAIDSAFSHWGGWMWAREVYSLVCGPLTELEMLLERG